MSEELLENNFGKKGKVFYKVEMITNTRATLTVQPSDEIEGIAVTLSQSDIDPGITVNLNVEEMELLILQMRDMMRYVKS